MLFDRFHREIGFAEVLIDAIGECVGIVGVEILRSAVVVVVEAAGDFERRLAAEEVHIFCRGIGIAVGVFLTFFEFKTVVAVISAHVKVVERGEFVREHQVGIVESGSTVLVSAFFGNQAQNPVGIRSACAKQERSAVFYDRTFEVKAAGEHTEAGITGEFLLVATLTVDVEHAREASAVLRRNITLIEFDIIHNIAVDGREETEQVVRVIDGVVVEEHEVLVGGTTAHAKSACALAEAFHARKGLNHLDDVHFAKCGGYG